MYYNVKIQYQIPVEETDEMKKKSEAYLVFAESCTEAEARMIGWMPANFQDPEVLDVKKTNINELKLDNKSSDPSYWQIKLLDDMDGTSDKKKPIIIIYDGDHLEEAVKKCGKDFMAEMETVTRFKPIIDDDLINQEIKKIIKKELPIKKGPVNKELEDLEEDPYDEDLDDGMGEEDGK